MNINIRNGNVIDELKKIPDESVDCVVSSPPYYSLRDYSGVAMYSDESIDKVKDIASSDLQKHRDHVSDPQKGRYYLTEPVFNEKEKKWFISLKYNVSEIWGGIPECEHEWGEVIPRQHEGGGNNGVPEEWQRPSRESHVGGNSGRFCNECGAWKGQLGLEPSYESYTQHLMLVMKELKRVLKKTGTLFWNIGDSYSGSDSDISSKSLMMIPEHFAIAMIDDGWILRNTLCWFKRNAMPSSVKDRFSNKWEYVFFFTKAQKYYFDLDSIRKPLEESSIKRITQENIPNQFQEGKSVDFAETDPVNDIPNILNNMHKKYNRANTGANNKEPYKKNNPHLMRLNANKQFFNEKGQGGNVDYNGIDSEDGNHYNENGANPGDVLFDDTIYDLYTDPSIQDAFIDYLESERPELLMPTLLDIPTMSHSFAHFAVFPKSLVDPLIKAGCPSEVCVKCGKPKERIVETNNPSKEFIDKSEEYYQSSGQSSKSLHRNKKDGMNGVYYTGKTIGWMPTCKCNAGFEPGTVLDPFAGSGTVGVVAKEQGKNAILIEVSPEYVEIIKNRLEIKGSGTDINAGFVDVASIESMEEDE